MERENEWKIPSSNERYQKTWRTNIIPRTVPNKKPNKLNVLWNRLESPLKITWKIPREEKHPVFQIKRTNNKIE